MGCEIEIKSEQERLERELMANRDKVIQMEEQFEDLNVGNVFFCPLKVVRLGNIFKEKEQQLKLKTELVKIKTRLDTDTVF
jgi:hypothetical protein